MKELTELQNKVFNEVLERLEDEPWFKGVCMDNFPEDDYIRDNFEDAVAEVETETAMWDDPDFYSNLGSE